MARGGYREGGGRKEGSVAMPKLSSFFTIKERDEYVKHIKARYTQSDKIAIFVGEQLFGKAVQTLAGDPNNPLVIEISEVIQKKHAAQSGSK